MSQDPKPHKLLHRYHLPSLPKNPNSPLHRPFHWGLHPKKHRPPPPPSPFSSVPPPFSVATQEETPSPLSPNLPPPPPKQAFGNSSNAEEDPNRHTLALTAEDLVEIEEIKKQEALAKLPKLEFASSFPLTPPPPHPSQLHQDTEQLGEDALETLQKIAEEAEEQLSEPSQKSEGSASSLEELTALEEVFESQDFVDSVPSSPDEIPSAYSDEIIEETSQEEPIHEEEFLTSDLAHESSFVYVPSAPKQEPLTQDSSSPFEEDGSVEALPFFPPDPTTAPDSPEKVNLKTTLLFGDDNLAERLQQVADQAQLEFGSSSSSDEVGSITPGEGVPSVSLEESPSSERLPFVSDSTDENKEIEVTSHTLSGDSFEPPPSSSSLEAISLFGAEKESNEPSSNSFDLKATALDKSMPDELLKIAEQLNQEVPDFVVPSQAPENPFSSQENLDSAFSSWGGGDSLDEAPATFVLKEESTSSPPDGEEPTSQAPEADLDASHELLLGEEPPRPISTELSLSTEASDETDSVVGVVLSESSSLLEEEASFLHKTAPADIIGDELSPDTDSPPPIQELSPAPMLSLASPTAAPMNATLEFGPDLGAQVQALLQEKQQEAETTELSEESEPLPALSTSQDLSPEELPPTTNHNSLKSTALFGSDLHKQIEELVEQQKAAASDLPYELEPNPPSDSFGELVETKSPKMVEEIEPVSAETPQETATSDSPTMSISPLSNPKSTLLFGEDMQQAIADHIATQSSEDESNSLPQEPQSTTPPQGSAAVVLTTEESSSFPEETNETPASTAATEFDLAPLPETSLPPLPEEPFISSPKPTPSPLSIRKTTSVNRSMSVQEFSAETAAKEGHFSRAIEIYNELQQEFPNEPRYQERIQQLWNFMQREPDSGVSWETFSTSASTPKQQPQGSPSASSLAEVRPGPQPRPVRSKKSKKKKTNMLPWILIVIVLLLSTLAVLGFVTPGWFVN